MIPRFSIFSIILIYINVNIETNNTHTVVAVHLDLPVPQIHRVAVLRTLAVVHDNCPRSPHHVLGRQTKFIAIKRNDSLYIQRYIHT